MTALKTAIWALVAMWLVACQSLPPAPHLPKSQSLTASLPAVRTTPSPLASQIDALTAHSPTLSGYLPIVTGANAFASRSILSDMASRTIDAQYYIWHDDKAGQLLLKDLWESAEQGVRVRLLLDDMNGSPSLDRLLQNLAKHPNIAVRVINPFLYRHARPTNYLTNPARINRRMHNKSMIFDGKIAILGGRNIGDEYLNNHQNNHFADLDVLLIGKVVDDIQKSFDAYWQSPLAFDIETLAKPTRLGLSQKSRQLIDNDNTAKQNATTQAQALKTYRQAIANATIGTGLMNQTLPFRYKKITFIADAPDKLLPSKAQDPNGVRITDDLSQAFGSPVHTLSIVSSYFVPTKQGVDELTYLAKSGVTVQILTNSYDATDVGMVHSGYAHWRKTLLRAGVRLFELKTTAKYPQMSNALPFSPHQQDNRLWRIKNHTTTSLHAKVFAVDDKRVFIGSYNIDPRSAHLNSEMGVLIDDGELAQLLHGAFDDRILTQAYEVKLNGDRLEWHTLENEQRQIFTKEPNMRLLHKMSVGILAWLPIEWLL